MSTLRVNTLQNTSTTDGGISIDTSGHVTVDGVAMPSSGPLSNRNKIINGDMRIDQRNAGASSTVTAAYTVDRWYARESGAGSASFQQVSDSPSSFSHSLKTTVTGTVSPLTAGDRLYVRQPIEGFNTSDLAFGTASAKTITISFWVKSSVTGQFGGAVTNSVIDRSYVFNFTVSTANTWEYKTVTIAGDTTGTWTGATNGVGLYLVLSMATGSTYQSTADSWQSGEYYNSSSSVNLLATSGATFYITGVQLEVGSVATPFEHRSYGDELARCQRYYQKTSASSTAPYTRLLPNGHMPTANALRCVVEFRPPMRARPTYNQSGTLQTSPGVGTPGLAIETSSSNESVSTLLDSTSISGTQGDSISIFASNDANAYVEFSAEL